MVNKTKNYLFYDFKHHLGGLDDHLKGLSAIISLSFSLDRIPVITGFHTVSDHNFNSSKKLVQFQYYVDLSKTCIFKANTSGAVEQVASSLYWLSDQDFDMQSFPEEQIAHIYINNRKKISALEENIEDIFDEKLYHYKVLYIQNISIKKFPATLSKDLHLWKIPMLNRIQRRETLLKPKGYAYFAILGPSQVVENLTGAVLNRIGIDRNEMANLKNNLMMRYRSELRNTINKIKMINCFYACLHVRVKHFAFSPRYFYARRPSKIKNTILATELLPGTKIYIMSDLHEREYFNFLRSDYQIYTYHDFPELKQLVSGEDGSKDNYMLYSVEKNIMSHALIQIIAPLGGHLIFPLDVSYYVPFQISKKYIYFLYKTYIQLTLSYYNLRKALHRKIKRVLKLGKNKE